MSVDEAVLESIQSGNSPPVLRLYAWFPPCISLGHAQPFSDIDPTRLNNRGWEVVRRITGGRAILHTDELTYSVIGPQGEPRLEGGVIDSYRRISTALMHALKSLNLPVKAVSKPKMGDRTNRNQEPVCFEVPSNYEITIHGKKLIGSAQARRKNTVLQHGTLPLRGDISRITDVLQFKDDVSRLKAKARLLSRASTVEAELGYQINWETAAHSFVQGFMQELNITFLDSELTREELSRAAALVNQKYAHPEWTERK
jgi:lipoate-protein ligase A